MPTAYSYSRHSEARPAADQQAEAVRHFEQRLAALGVTWGGHYVDVAEMRKRRFRQRTAATRLFVNVQPGDVVIVPSAATAWKNGSDMVATLQAWQQRKVASRVLDINLFTDEAQGADRLGFLGKVDQADQSRRSEVAAARQAGLKQERRPTGGYAPPGWKIVGRPGQKKYAPDEWERQCIGKFVELYNKGHTISVIYFWAIQHGVRRSCDKEWGRDTIWRCIAEARRQAAATV